MWEIFTIFLLVVMFNIFVIFPRGEKYPFLELLGFTFLGTAALEFAHAITYPGYIYNNPALSTEFWMFTRGFF
ncbi:MASE3 domain-containing protein [Caldanaerobius fijiensis]|uniref:MASE3 domain-containing protein n=1 Tax=Caldanaerobius fijiensis TaxID=456330 RepID=UPI0038996CBE